jgi:flavodoxin I
MKKTVLLYWTPGGSVERAAKVICKQIGTDKVDLCDLSNFDINKLGDYDNLIIGSATIGADVWRDANDNNKWNEFFVKAEGMDLSDKKIAAFGLGNQIFYPDNFVDSLGYMKTEVEKLGGKLLGAWPAEGYKFTDSEGYKDGMFFGLALDEDQQPELSEQRIKSWIELLGKDMHF